jgi:HlyD family secretion protein
MWIVEAIKSRASLLVLGALGAGVFAYEWRSVKHAEMISSAEAKPAQAKRSGVLAEGRVATYPGAEITLGAELGGRIARLSVKERDSVKKGDVIAELDVREQRAALNEAWARVREADNDVGYLRGEETRSEQLFGQNVLAQAAFDKSTHETRSARARKVSLQASAARLESVLDKSKVLAPIDGRVSARFADPGEMVAPGAPLVTIVDLSQLRIEAEVGEFDAPQVVLGAPVTISAEGHDGKTFRGTVEEIPDLVVPRRMKALDPSRPVDTRVLVVKIKLQEPVPLKLGQRVEIEIQR